MRPPTVVDVVGDILVPFVRSHVLCFLLPPTAALHTKNKADFIVNSSIYAH